MLLKIYPQNPNSKAIQQVVQVLKKGGVIIYPTDTVYALGCDILNSKGIERICQIRGIKPEKAKFSFVCSDLSHLSQYSKSIDTPTFRVLKKALPGPFTFILNANNQVPKLLHNNKKTIGIRVIEHAVVQAILTELGNPILTASLKLDDDFLEYFTDPEEIYEHYHKRVDMIIDSGLGGNRPSTVVDCTQANFEIVRQGKGDLEVYLR